MIAAIYSFSLNYTAPEMENTPRGMMSTHPIV